ncbi:MAG: hypothetical protein HPY74_19295 [Firmicutes bacterium]|nr:hypothetical protein [Bacillota bacterium]
MDPLEFRALQTMPYEYKKKHAITRAQEFYEAMNGRVFCSVGGLDSITLLIFLRKYVNPNITGISVSGLEDKSIQQIHRQFDNFVLLTPYKSKVQVIRECGFPVISKEKAGKIKMLQKPSEKNATVRHAIMTGETGKQGGFRKGTRMKLPQKWLNLFGGPENEKYGTNYQTAPFKVSADCCYYMKEKPADDWAKQNGLKPYMGLMASEGGQREKALVKHGCNYFGKTVTRSCPFAIFNRQDILQLAIELNTPVPAIYGEIIQDPDGTLRTTKAQRTGCTMCGFGIHIEKRPHRFDRLRETSPKEWHFWMYECVTDESAGEKYGWGKVLDYIGIKWEDIPPA